MATSTKKRKTKRTADNASALQKLIDIMRYTLTSYWRQKAEKVETDALPALSPDDPATWLPEDTVINTGLDPNDGYGMSNSVQLFRGVILDVMIQEKWYNTKKPFPGNWTDLTIKDLAGKLVILFAFILTSLTAASQIQVRVGAVNTDAKASAITFAFQYAKALDSAFKTRDFIVTGKNSFLLINPSVNAEFGNADAMGSINAKIEGLIVHFKRVTVSGVSIPDANRSMQTFPISVGVETSSLFNVINGILEAAWVPRYQAQASDIVAHSKFMLGIQAGYKFWASKTTVLKVGGLEDQSMEKVKSSILRAHGALSIDTKKVVKIQGLDAGLVGSGEVWYDVMNGALYHKIDASVRFYLPNGTFLDLLYERGSGAPFFNDANQWGFGIGKGF